LPEHHLIFLLAHARDNNGPLSFNGVAVSIPAQQRGDYAMRKILLVSVIALAPLAAFADDHHGGTSSSVSRTDSSSGAGVLSNEKTNAGVDVGGNGHIAAGAVSGNTSSMETQGRASVGRDGSTKTNATATQTNTGGTLAGGASQSSGHHGGDTSGGAGGSQTSTVIGGSTANASDVTRESSGGHSYHH
jgi:hypothetical protein